MFVRIPITVLLIRCGERKVGKIRSPKMLLLEHEFPIVLLDAILDIFWLDLTVDVVVFSVLGDFQTVDVLLAPLSLLFERSALEYFYIHHLKRLSSTVVLP